MATNGTFANQEQYKGSAEQPAATTATPETNAAGNNLSKDEVGWYFVEQYYTTLSKSPEKLHLFYSKRSQFVSGLEAEVANVSVGRQAIQERIKELDFQDCKVRVSNVDSQASFDNIVIQVIGEVSNKAGEPKKFVQTFVLAQQPSGYFVLNDILRYINEDEEEVTPAVEVETEAPAAELEVAAPEIVAPAEPEPVEEEAAKEEAVEAEVVEESSAKTNGTEADEAAEVTETAEVEAEEPAPVDVETTAEVVEESVKEAEQPKEPTPAPVVKPVAQPVEATPAEPAAPPKPMTWASRAAAAAGPRPVVPLPKTATPPATSQGRAPAPVAPAASAAAAAPAPATTQPGAPVPAAEAAAPAKEASGWQTAGVDSKRQGRPQSTSGNVVEKDGTMGYVKYVTEKVQDADLRGALAAHGELTYFDINRAKNCAFVEYKSVEGYQAALNSNPHVVNGENIYVEPRRPKSTNYGPGNYGPGRGNASGRGRGGFDGGRAGGQNPRGNFSGQGRGRGGAARGRGGAQATNA